MIRRRHAALTKKYWRLDELTKGQVEAKAVHSRPQERLTLAAWCEGDQGMILSARLADASESKRTRMCSSNLDMTAKVPEQSCVVAR